MSVDDLLDSVPDTSARGVEIPENFFFFFVIDHITLCFVLDIEVLTKLIAMAYISPLY